MVIDAREPVRNYPIPAEGNTISEDFARLILALTAIGVDVGQLIVDVAGKAAAIHEHQLADVDGLVTALANKSGIDHTHALGGLSDVDTAGAATYQVLAKALDGKWRPWTIDLANAIGAAAYARLNGADFTGPVKVPTSSITADSLNAANVTMVRAAVAALVASSPTALDTLNELAAALGNDPNFATTITNALALKAPLSSPAFTDNPTGPTRAIKNNTTSLANCAFVQGEKAYAKSWVQLVGNAYTMDANYLGRLTYFNRTASGDTTVTMLDPAGYGLAIIPCVNVTATKSVVFTTPAGNILYGGAASSTFTLPPGNFVEFISNGVDWVVTRTGLAPLPSTDWLAGTSTVEASISPEKLAGAIAALTPDPSAVTYQEILTSGTWSKPAGLDPDALVLVFEWGGGGGYTTSGEYRGGGGGGSCAWGLWRASMLPDTVPVTIGAGALGNAAGGTTSFNGLNAPGGQPGVGATGGVGGDSGFGAAFVGGTGGPGSGSRNGSPGLWGGGGGHGQQNSSVGIGGTSVFGGRGSRNDGTNSPGQAPGGGGGNSLQGGAGMVKLYIIG